MNVAILGGTGKEGAGLASRWAQAGHAIIIGSRDAGARAEQGRRVAPDHRPERDQRREQRGGRAARRGGRPCPPRPGTRQHAPRGARRVPGQGGDQHRGPPHLRGRTPLHPAAAGSSAEEAQALLPEATVVAAFHHIAAHELSSTEHPIECDLLLCGGDARGQAGGRRSRHLHGVAQRRRGTADQRRAAGGDHRRPGHHQPPLQAEELRHQDHRALSNGGPRRAPQAPHAWRAPAAGAASTAR